MSNPDATQDLQPEIKKKLDELKSQRSSTKGNMTRIKNQITANIETISKVELECRVNIFEQYWKLWLSHQTSIEKLKPNDVSNELIRSEVEDLYCEVKVLYSTRNHSEN
jgi:predicted DNA-binding protein